MKKNENEGMPSQAETTSATSREVDRRLAVLRAELKFDYPDLVNGLESGIQIVLFNSSRFGTSLHPDNLRRIGGLVAMCRLHGAAVMFVDPDKVHEFVDAA